MPDTIADVRGTLKRERDELRAQMDHIDAALAALTAIERPGQHRRERARGTGRSRARQGTVRANRLPRGALVAAIVDALTGAPGRGLHGDEVLARLEQRGLVPRGANPKASLADALQRLTRQGKVTKVGPNTWRRA